MEINVPHKRPVKYWFQNTGWTWPPQTWASHYRLTAAPSLRSPGPDAGGCAESGSVDFGYVRQQLSLQFAAQHQGPQCPAQLGVRQLGGQTEVLQTNPLCRSQVQANSTVFCYCCCWWYECEHVVTSTYLPSSNNGFHKFPGPSVVHWGQMGSNEL